MYSVILNCIIPEDKCAMSSFNIAVFMNNRQETFITILLRVASLPRNVIFSSCLLFHPILQS